MQTIRLLTTVTLLDRIVILQELTQPLHPCYLCGGELEPANTDCDCRIAASKQDSDFLSMGWMKARASVWTEVTLRYWENL